MVFFLKGLYYSYQARSNHHGSEDSGLVFLVDSDRGFLQTAVTDGSRTGRGGGFSGLLPKRQGKSSEPGHQCLSVQAFHGVKCVPCLFLTDNTVVGSSLQLLCKCHFLNWLPGAGLQTASCGPGAMLGSSQGRSLLFLLGRYHHLHCLAEREAWQEVERAWVKPELV